MNVLKNLSLFWQRLSYCKTLLKHRKKLLEDSMVRMICWKVVNSFLGQWYSPQIGDCASELRAVKGEVVVGQQVLASARMIRIIRHVLCKHLQESPQVSNIGRLVVSG